MSPSPTVLCIASFFEGNDFLRECAAALVEDYRRRFAADFLAVVPAEEGPGQHL